MSNTATNSLSMITNKDCIMSQVPQDVLTPIAEFFKMLSEVSRLQILCALKSGPQNVTQIQEMTGLGQANVSKHLKILTQAGIISRTQQGINVIYQIANPLVFPLCDLVCNSLTNQIEQQQEQLQALKTFQQSF